MLKKNVLANYLGQIWSAIMAIAFVPLYISYLGIESYGLIGLFAVLQAWLVLLDMGMAPTMGREMARFTGGTHNAQSIRNLLRSIEIIALSIAVAMVAGIVLSAEWLATHWLNTQNLLIDDVVNAFVIMGIVAALRFLEGIYLSSLNGLQQQVVMNMLRIVFSTLRGLGSVMILAWVSPTIASFFMWQGLLAFISLFCHAGVIYRFLPDTKHRAVFSRMEVEKIMGYAGGMLGITFLSLLLTQADKIILSSLLPLTVYGFYSFAAVIAGALFMLVGPISGAWFPRLSQLYAQGDDKGLIRTYHLGAQLVSVVAGSAALVIIYHSESLLTLWTSDPELARRTALLFSLLVAGNFLNCLMWIPYQAQLAYGWTSLATKINFVAVIVVLPR